MYVIHARWQVPVEETEAFFRWKAIEGAMQAAQPGFIERTMYRGIEQPELFIYVSIWETADHAAAYGAAPAFRAAAAEAMRSMPKTVIAIDRMTDLPEHRVTQVNRGGGL